MKNKKKDEKNQIMTTSVWITQIWNDYRFAWDPINFGNISTFNLPVNDIWVNFCSLELLFVY